MRFFSLMLLLFLAMPTIAETQSDHSIVTENTENCVTKAAYLASTLHEFFLVANEYAIEKDLVALQKLLETKLVFLLKADIPIVVEKINSSDNSILVQVKGLPTITFWTHINALKCK